MKKLILLSFLLWVSLITGLPETGLSRQKRQSGRANVQVNRSGSRGRQTVASRGSASGRATVQVSLLALAVNTMLFIKRRSAYINNVRYQTKYFLKDNQPLTNSKTVIKLITIVMIGTMFYSK